ncbi:hypothetical protein [Thiocystis violacea]|uniref:phage tail tube protein n=1 Tax=Thiocystis violacea TaxID=13725 RepID=UPI001903AFF9|nr:hypothetical protein [Thiocystis violacea]MBK1719226.1 hypothetical protein [Thiocystis violacea]
MSGLLLAVDAHIDRFTAGVAAGFMDAINLPKLSITQPDPDSIIRTSFMRSTKGQALDSYLSPKPVEIEFDTDECAPDILSMALLGRPADYAQAAGTSQSLTIAAKLGKWVAIGKNNLSAFAVATKTAGTDYEINMEAGLFKSLTIADGDVSATASYPARSGSVIVSGTESVLQIAIHGHGINLFNSQQIEIEIWQANVSPTGGISFITADPATLSFKGTLITPTGKTGPYQLTLHSAAA